MKQLIKICSILLIFIMINLVFLPVSYAETVQEANQDPHENEPSSLQKTYFFMRKGKLLHPESPSAEEAPKTIACPSASEPMFPRLPFNRPRVYKWVSLPANFETNALNSPLTLGHHVMFRLWFTATKDESLETIRFQFTLHHNNNPIAQTDPVSYGRTLPAGEEAFVTASAGINITGNRIAVGDTLEIHIDYYVTGEGLAIKFDNPLYDSGMEIEANPIKIGDIRATRTQVSALFSESFNVNTQKLLFITKIDEVPLETEPKFSSTTEGRMASWKIDTPLKKGTHTIVVMASYGSNANETMVMKLQEIKITYVEPIKIFGKDLNFWFSIIVLIIVLILIASVLKIWKNRRDERLLMELDT